MSRDAVTPLRYRVEPFRPSGHEFAVDLTVPEPDAAGQRLTLPAWIPGSYLVRDFARHIVEIAARDGDGSPVPLTKEDKQTWRAAPAKGPLLLTTVVHAHDPSVRSAWLDRRRGFFNGTSLFLEPVGHEHRPCELQLDPPPAGCVDGEWGVATALSPAGAAEGAFGTYRAVDYATLIDSPVAMAPLARVGFEVAGIPHTIAISGQHRADLQRLAEDVQRICEEQVAVFGELPVTERYVFYLHVVGDGYGGLEHADSTALVAKRDHLPRPGGDVDADGYAELLGLFSHEYFHLWNVKRIRPAAFSPYDLRGEVHTTLLWAFEGITSYYDDRALITAGRIGRDAYLERLGRVITRVLRGSGRHRQSVADSSFDAWTRFYQQDANAPNAIVSYYAKGALVALALDLLLRRDAGVRLDDVMRRLWVEHGRPGIGVPEDGVQQAAEAVSGLDLGDFFVRYVHGTEDPPLAELLETVGVALRSRPRSGRDDRGGTAGGDSVVPAWTGAVVADEQGSTRVRTVHAGSPAEAAGLSPGDELVAVAGLRATAAGLDEVLRRYPAGEALSVHAFRHDELITTTLRATEPPRDTYYLDLVAEPAPEQEQRREEWLGHP
ncbi:MAG: M61 family metallopeptidase [Pseudomonadota bacterium]